MEYNEQALQEVRESRLLLNRLDEWLFDLVTPFIGNRILEIGCGYGNMMPNLLGRDLIIGIDIAQNAVNEINQKYADSPNVHAICMDVTDPALMELKQYHFDTVISVNVFEHIDDDLLAMKHVYDLLEPDGNFILIVPAHSILYGTMDKSIGHFRRYSKHLMASNLQSAGFYVSHQRYLNILGSLGWFVNGIILRRKIPPRNQLKLFNTFMPLIVSIENKIQFPVGLSLLSIATRPA